MEMAPEEVEARLAAPEVDHTGLVRVQAATEVTQMQLRLSGVFGLCLGRHNTTR